MATAHNGRVDQEAVPVRSASIGCRVRFRLVPDASEFASASGDGDQARLSLDVVAYDGAHQFGGVIEASAWVLAEPPELMLVSSSWGDPPQLPGGTVAVSWNAPVATVGSMSVSGQPSDPRDPLGSTFLTVLMDTSALLDPTYPARAHFHFNQYDTDDGKDLIIEVDDCTAGGESPQPAEEALADAEASVSDASDAVCSSGLPISLASQVSNRLDAAVSMLSRAQTDLAQGNVCQAARDASEARDKFNDACRKAAAARACPSAGASCISAGLRAELFELLKSTGVAVEQAVASTCRADEACLVCAPKALRDDALDLARTAKADALAALRSVLRADETLMHALRRTFPYTRDTLFLGVAYDPAHDVTRTLAALPDGSAADYAARRGANEAARAARYGDLDDPLAAALSGYGARDLVPVTIQHGATMPVRPDLGLGGTESEWEEAMATYAAAAGTAVQTARAPLLRAIARAGGSVTFASPRGPFIDAVLPRRVLERAFFSRASGG